MIHPEHLRPPPHDHPADNWNIVEKDCQSRFRARHGAHSRLGSGAPGHAGALRQAAPIPKLVPASTAFVESVRLCTAKNLVTFVARRGQIAQRAGRIRLCAVARRPSRPERPDSILGRPRPRKRRARDCLAGDNLACHEVIKTAVPSRRPASIGSSPLPRPARAREPVRIGDTRQCRT
jgi:hypothetical protein